MTIYVDLYFLLNFVLDLFSILICQRVLGYRLRIARLILASFIGACYSVAVLRFSAPYAILVHLMFGALMLLIACGFGSTRRFLRLLLLFFGVCFLLGGAVTAIGRGISLFRTAGSRGHLTLSIVLAAALIGGMICLYWGRSTLLKKGHHALSVTVNINGHRLTFKGYADSGNVLRDPLEATPVILANRTLSHQIYGLFTNRPPPSLAYTDPKFYEGMPLRLIPCDTVAGKVILPALKITEAEVEGETIALCIALDFARKGDYCGFDALIPSSIL